MEHNTPNKIYVYDRLNRRLYECGITEIKGNWAYYNFNGKECVYWLGGSVVASENVSDKPYNYKCLVSIDRKSLCEIKESDVTIFSIINNSLRNQCEELLLGPTHSK